MRGEAEIEAEVRRFSHLGALLKIILHPQNEPDPEVRRRLTRLHAWGATTVYPLLQQVSWTDQPSPFLPVSSPLG
ncbi:hypothetical protein O7632_25605 [Solwaraspora sp. WMMD406]|uniref:hypothetical protein n=1 Tax=Solwaraspora sp. WMMD406 TaxID=3016095 RepID=UPI0024174E21|nr:hypothetical protein [Solwaraspora sp. WMMD406]MDG4767440.1 hypothetical protein [Solwaraspora sp. WMMD406]